MKKSLLLSVLFLQFLTAQTPTFDWAKNFGDYQSEAMATVTDPSGNIYTLGKFSDTGDFDSSSNTFNLTALNLFDSYITKYDSSGNFVWAKSFGSSTDTDLPTSITLDGSGNVYATGSFLGTGDFNPGSGVNNLTSVIFSGTYYPGTFILKLDVNGDFVWAKSIIQGFGNSGNSIKIDTNGNILVGGNFTYQADFDPGAGSAIITGTGYSNIYVLKLDTAGNYVWAKTMVGNGQTKTYGITLDANNAIITSGVFKSTIDFDPSAVTYNLTSNGADDIFISKLDADGVFVWAKRIGGSDNDVAKGICSDANSNSYLTGNFFGVVDFDPSASTFNLNATIPVSNFDSFILKLDITGNLVWAKKVGGTTNADDSRAITLDSAGSVYTTGTFQEYTNLVADFDPGIGVYNLQSGTAQDAYFLKLDTNGNFVWAFNYDSSYGLRITNSITVATSGAIYSIGRFAGGLNNDTDFDFSSGTSLLSAYKASFLLKLNQPSLGLNQNQFSKVSLYPNPATNEISLALDIKLEKAKLKVISTLGQTVLEKQNVSGNNLNIDVSNLAKGVYIVEVNDGFSVKNAKFIKQ
jgi:hypothetical protein